MKQLLCLVFVAVFMVACSSDSTDPAPQPSAPAPAAKPAEEAVQRATETVQQVVEKGQELKDEAGKYVEKTSETVAAKAQELEVGAEKLVQQGSDRLAALVPSAATFDQGSSIYQQNCRSCHDSGMMGAPKIGHARYRADIDVLVENSINGVGRMPARGGNRNLTDDQVRAVVEYMVEKSK